MLKRVDHLGIAVESLQESLPFYTEKLGLSVAEEMEIPGRVKIVTLALEDACIELLEYLEPLEERKNSGRVAGIAHFAVGVQDIEETMAKLKERGVEFVDAAPRTIPNGVRVAFLKAPDNVLIELVEK